MRRALESIGEHYPKTGHWQRTRAHQRIVDVVDESVADHLVRMARGQRSFAARVHRIAALDRIAAATKDTRRHYSLCVPCWRAIDAEIDALAQVRFERIGYSFPSQTLWWRASVAGRVLARHTAPAQLTALGLPLYLADRTTSALDDAAIFAHNTAILAT